MQTDFDDQLIQELNKSKDWETLPLDTVDISQARIVERDILIVFNDQKNHRHVLMVTGVGDTDENTRKITAKVVYSSDPRYYVGREYKIELNRNIPINGAIIPHNDTSEYKKFLNLEKVSLIELIRVVETKEHQKMPFSEALDYLLRRNLMSMNDSEKVQKQKLRELIKRQTRILGVKFLESKGGWIRHTGAELDESESFIPAGYERHNAIHVDFNKLVLGLRFMLESFSVFKVVYKDE